MHSGVSDVGSPTKRCIFWDCTMPLFRGQAEKIGRPRIIALDAPPVGVHPPETELGFGITKHGRRHNIAWPPARNPWARLRHVRSARASLRKASSRSASASRGTPRQRQRWEKARLSIPQSTSTPRRSSAGHRKQSGFINGLRRPRQSVTHTMASPPERPLRAGGSGDNGGGARLWQCRPANGERRPAGNLHTPAAFALPPVEMWRVHHAGSRTGDSAWSDHPLRHCRPDSALPGRSVVAASRLACTALSTKQKSRLVSPSPLMVTCSPSSSARVQRGITAA
jgi:hypothetical protein